MKINVKRILIVIISIVSVLTILMFTQENKVESIEKPKSHTSLTSREFTSSLSEIDSNTITFDQVIPLSSLIVNNGYNFPSDLGTNENYLNDNIKFRIDTASDLYHFMIMCNQNSNFSKCSFILGSDIDYAEQSAKRLYVTPILNFSGIFDGQGYTISNLYFKTLTQEDINNLPGLSSISIFNNNTGTIRNLGIVNTYIIQTRVFDTVNVAATLVGTNDIEGTKVGTIENVFVTDLRTTKSGLICEGGYYCSSFVGTNRGVIRNCYIAVNNIINETIRYQSDSSRFPVLLNNIEGTIENVFFDDGVLNQRYNDINNSYASTKDNINSVFKNVNGWYTKDEYPLEYRVIFNNQYPLLQGLESVVISGVNFFIIESHIDFAIFYKMIKQYAAFRNAKYIVVDNIDLNKLNSTSLQPIDIPFTGTIESAVRIGNDYSLILENGTDFSGNAKLKDGSYSKCYSICNLNISQGISSGSGFKCFGLFPVLNGIVKDLNIYNLTINIDDNSDISNEPILVGGITGFLNNGSISNCHVLGTININHTKNVESNVGMIVGKNNESTTIENVTASGTIEVTSTNSKVSCGGILGLIDNGLVQNCLNGSTIKVESSLTSVKDIIIGGVVGSGVTDSCTKLQNKGTIEVNSHTNLRGYISGVFGMHTNGTKVIGEFKNSGIINTKNIDTNTKMYVSGVMISKISSSDFVNYSSLTNSGSLNFIKSSSLGIVTMKQNNTNTFGDTTTGNIDLHVCGNLFVIASNVIAKGIYRNGDSDQNIDISIISEYAPCVRTHDEGNLSSYKVKLTQVYNTKNINYITTNEPQFHDIKLSGCISGGHVDLNQCRNEGNITLTFSNPSTNALNQNKGSYNNFCKTLRLYGVCEEIDPGLYGRNLYNGGDILVNTTLNTSSDKIKYCIYVSGICSRNNAEEDITVNNIVPLMLTNVEGGLYNCLNDGNIDIVGSENKSFYGVTRASGICTYNLSTIKNCYNLGNIYNRNYIEDIRAEYNDEAEVESSGIVFFMLGSSAAIIDCANNGNIISQNTSSSRSWVNAAGIILRNDKFENGSDASTNSNGHYHHMQKVEFSINYGNIYAFNNEVTNQVDGESRCKAAGILALGLCSIINVINYGDVYSVDTAGAMYGLVFMEKFGNAGNGQDDPNKTPVYIANALNYGKVRRAHNPTTTITNYTCQPSENTTWNQIGALIGIIKAADSSTSVSLNKVKISYLINFDDRVNMIGGTSGFGNINNAIDEIKNTLRYMATLKEVDTSEEPFNINTTNGTGIKSYSLDNASPTTTITNPYDANYYKAENNGGIFNENYSLRNPDPNSVVETDKYIADYFQYIGYSKINEYLIEKLGLNNTVLSVAYNMLFSNYESLSKIINHSSLNIDVNSKFNETFSSDTVLQAFINTNKEKIRELLKKNIEINQETILNEQLNSFFSDQNYQEIESYTFVDNLVSKIINNCNDTELQSLFSEVFNSDDFYDYYTSNQEKVYNVLSQTSHFKSETYDQNYQEIYNNMSDSQKVSYKQIFLDNTTYSIDSVIENFDETNQNHMNIMNQYFANMTNTTTLTYNDITLYYDLFKMGSNNKDGIYYIPTANVTHQTINGELKGYNFILNNKYGVDANGSIYAGTHYNENGTNPSSGFQVMILDSTEGGIVSRGNTTYNVGYVNGNYVNYSDAVTNQNNVTENKRYITDDVASNIGNYPIIYCNSRSKQDGSYTQQTWFVNITYYYSIYTYSGFTIPTYIKYDSQTDYLPNDFSFLEKMVNSYTVEQKVSLFKLILRNIKDNNSAYNKLAELLCKINNYQSNITYSIDTTLSLLMANAKDFTTTQLNTFSNQIFTIINNGKSNVNIETSSPFKEFVIDYINKNGSRKKIFEYGYNNGKVSVDSKYDIFIDLLLNKPTRLKTNTYVNRGAKSDILGYYIVQSSNRSETYHSITGDIIPNDSINNFENHLKNTLGLNPSDFLDFTGIYALASSQGILNGQFIPDNLVLPNLDPVVFVEGENGEYTERTSDQWRKYDANSQTIDTSKVDYKVNVMMKQLKQSIATTVFKVTLTNTDKDVFYSNFDVKNIKNNTIKFDIPLNDQLLKDNKAISVITSNNVIEYINENTKENFYIELANKAKLIRTDTINYDISILQPNHKLTFKFDVQAEDKTVITTYTVEINLLPNKEIDQVLSANIDGTSCSFTNNVSFSNSITGTVISNTLNATGNNTFTANVQITNVPNGYNMNDHVKLYDSSGALVTNNFDLSATTVSNNSFNISFKPKEELPSGTYQIRCYINSDKYYPIEIKKAKSDKNDIISITTLDGVIHEGLVFTQNGEYKEIDIDVKVGLEYQNVILSEILFSPHATHLINPVHITTPSDFTDMATPKTYTIEIDVTSESNITQKYLIRLNEYIDKTINNIYENGRLMSDTEYSELQDYIDIEFEYNNTPDYSFEMDLSKYIISGDARFTVKSRVNNPSSDVATSVLDNGFSITFPKEALSGEYVFYLGYEKSVNYNGSILGWDYVISKEIHITKNYNKNSYFDNIEFISETIIGNQQTKITQTPIDPSIYNNTESELTVNVDRIVYDSVGSQVDEFYVIGVVNKTDLTNYLPIFTLPEKAKVYRIENITVKVYDDATQTYVDSNVQTIVRDANVNGLDQFVYEDINTQTSYILVNNEYVVVTNTITYNALDGSETSNTLRSDFINYNNDGAFKYVSYRLYSDERLNNNVSTRATYQYFTDYHIAVIDSTNVINFNISIVDTTGDINKVYISLTNYELIEDPNNPINKIKDETQLISTMGKLAVYNSNSWDMNKFQNSASGFFDFVVELPDGYEYILKIGENEYHASNNNECGIKCEGDITTVTIDVEIKIFKIDLETNYDSIDKVYKLTENGVTMIETPKKWGVNYEDTITVTE